MGLSLMALKQAELRDDIQQRVANISIGASTLRGQGPPGFVRTAREFLMKLNLGELDNIDEEQFKNWLDENTEKLMEKFPGAKKNWGAARKSMNVFLEHAFYDRFLAEEYKLYELEDFLEIPIDSHVNEGLLKNNNYDIRFDLPGWRGIKNLTPEDNEIYQNCARYVAKKEGKSRIYLDLKFWRQITLENKLKPALEFIKQK